MPTRGFALGAALAVAVAGCTADDPAPVEEAPPPSAGVYAYLAVEFGASLSDTRSELHVMDGTEEIGASGPLLLASRPTFTVDGDFVFTLPSFVDEILAISVATGETTRVPCAGCGDRQTECACEFLAPVGGSEIAWLDGPANELVRLDLAADSPTPRRTGITVPTADGFLDELLVPNLITGTDGAVLAAYPRGLPGDDLLPAYLVPLEGETRRLAPDRPDSVEQAAFSPDGTRVALTGNQEYACATVTVADVATGTGPTAPVAAEPGTTCANHDVYVESLWWDRDGTLNVVFEADRDNSTAENSTAENSTVENGQRRFEGDRWVDTGGAPGSEVRLLSAGTATIESDAPGPLYVETESYRTQIATDVRYVTAAP